MENSDPEYESCPDTDPCTSTDENDDSAAFVNAEDSNGVGGVEAAPTDPEVDELYAEAVEDHEPEDVFCDTSPPSEVVALNVRHLLDEESLLSAMEYQPRPDDVFVVSYPRCGCTLLQFLLFGIYNRGQPGKNFGEFAARSPYLEELGAKGAVNMTRPGAIKTHLPFDKHPYSPSAKFIYVTRNPFDCCAAYYAYMKNWPIALPEAASFDVFFDAFLEGRVPYGDFFDHIISWYERRHLSNVMFLTYENVKTDPRTWTIRIAEFLDEYLAQELRDDPALLGSVLNIATTDTMTNMCKHGTRSYLEDELALASSEKEDYDSLPLEFYKRIFNESLDVNEASDFARRPAHGDWKELFQPQHVQRMKEWVTQKTARSDVLSIWSNNELP